MPQPLPSIDFHAQHSPFGAFASFTLGRHGARGGFGLELPGPAEQDVFVALVRPDESVQALPFFVGADNSGPEAYSHEVAGPADATPPEGWKVFGADEMTRRMGWASDTWTAGDLTFSMLTPFCPVPDIAALGDVELRRLLCPALLAELSVDNTASHTEAYAFFGTGGSGTLRPLSDGANGLVGVAQDTRWGFAVVPGPDFAAREMLSWDIYAAVRRASTAASPPPLNRLANRGGILFTVPPGERRTFSLALGFFRHGVATSGIATTYLYSRLFHDLEAVLSFALANAEQMRRTAHARDAELDAAHISDERKFLLAHATHSYHGSTMLMNDERGVLPRAPYTSSTSPYSPLWVVNEGENRRLNTFDLTIDHAFFEMRFHPWTVQSALDLFVGRYCYWDEVQDTTDPTRPRFDGGVAFTHDMGVANQFTPPGTSAYERPNLDGCYSYMAQEQLCNWCLCAALFGLKTRLGDGNVLWLASRRTTLVACLESLIRRDGRDEMRDGVMSLDTARCGAGQEVTTYDSLDLSLSQARGSLYLAVKTWSTYLALSRCFDVLGLEDRAAEAEEQAARAAATIAAQWDATGDCFPAVFDPGSPGFRSRVIPAIEGVLFPYLWNDDEAVSPFGPYGQLAGQLRRHLKSVLTPGVCVDPESGGWKISSTSDNTWMSKIFLCQFVAEKILALTLPDEFDAVHAGWQRAGACRDFAFTDQVRSADGKDLGSRYYPRGVTSILWLT
jgi:hypothetical protein